jgi:hypothetical protein
VLLNLLIEYPLVAIALWAVVYLSDYYFTLAGARLYRSGANEHVVFEGSYELTPYYQGDVDRLSRFSRRLWLALAFSCVALLAVWWAAVQVLGMTWLFSFLLGALLLREAVVHLRHFRNIVLFRLGQRPDGLRGRLEYPRWLVLRASASELFAFAGLFVLLAAIADGWFFLGGAAACAVTGLQHTRQAGKAPRQAPPPEAA